VQFLVERELGNALVSGAQKGVELRSHHRPEPSLLEGVPVFSEVERAWEKMGGAWEKISANFFEFRRFSSLICPRFPSNLQHSRGIHTNLRKIF